MIQPARAALVALLLPLVGCAHRVALTSSPAGAYVSLGGERVGVTPLELELQPFGPRDLRLELTGYRTFELKIRGKVPPALELRMIREHGGAGTWEPEEVR